MKIQKIKLVVASTILMMVASTHAANLDIGLFTTGQFTVDIASSYVPTQSVSGLTSNLTVAAGDIFYGNFAAPMNWSSSSYKWTSLGAGNGYTNSSLGLSMEVASQAAPTPFTFTLFDSTFAAIQTFTGTTVLSSPAATTRMDVALAPTSASGFNGGLITDVAYAAFSWDGPGAINTTLYSVTIPEPSSASLLALGMAGLVALRARRKS
jgi:PEP-CTERM motif